MKVVATVVALIALTLTTYVKTRADADAEPFKGSLGQSTPPRIAFTRMREDVDRANSDYRVEAEIWMTNADGGQLRLTRNTTDDLGAVWSRRMANELCSSQTATALSQQATIRSM
jgi:hypothetical protein